MEKKDSEKLPIVTNQNITISIGGRSFEARRATMYDLGMLSKYVKKKQDENDTGSLNLDASLYALCMLIQDDIQPEDLAKSLPFNAIVELDKVLALLGLTLPQQMTVTPEK